jgi:membrane glycosyltransferase
LETFTVPNKHNPEKWNITFLNQIATARAMALISTILLIYVNYQTMLAQGFDLSVSAPYLLVYGLMSYWVLWFLSKMVVGAWGMMYNHKLPDHPSQSMRDPFDDTRVAVNFPVYHEDVARVAAGMAATWESIQRHTPEYADRYDIFLLSDSRKKAYIEAEERAILELRQLFPQGRFYYRWRPSNTHAKIGNVTDFCRRWGKAYKYIFAMDADSICTGETIHTTLKMMEGRPKVGILQTNPKAVFRTTIFGRMQQFASNLFGIAFTTTLRATMLGNGTYMGHNAMVRTKAFMDHCILPTLPGKAPWGGKPLSHDVVESALMAAYGYETWFLPELEGSWEEVPANILASLIRERRWMQGNLQHSRLLKEKIFPSAYKEYFVAGMFAYLTAPLWAAFIILSAYVTIKFLSNGIVDPETAELIIINTTIVGVFTLGIFILLRAISLASVFTQGQAHRYGGGFNLLLSVIVEFFFSMIYAPIVMLAMTKFIYKWVMQETIVWDVQDRGDNTLLWKDCFRHFGWMSVVGVAFLGLMIYYSSTIADQDIGLMLIVSNGYFNPYSWLYMMGPLLAGAILAPVIVRSSSASVEYFKNVGLFLTPEETSQPPEFTTLEVTEKYLREYLPAY